MTEVQYETERAHAASGNPPLSPSQHRRKEQILTQHHAAHFGASNAVVLKHGELFLLTDQSGDVPWKLPHAFGVYFRDVRFLDGYEFTIDDQPMTALSSVDVFGYRTRQYLTNPRLDGRVERNTLEIRRDRMIRARKVYERLTVRNHGTACARIRLCLRFRSLFEDLFVLKGFVDGPRCHLLEPQVEPGRGVRLCSHGPDGAVRSLTLLFDPPPLTVTPGFVLYDLELEQRGAFEIVATMQPAIDAAGDWRPSTPQRHELLTHWLARAADRWSATTAQVKTSHEIFDRAVERCVSDLGVLRSRLDGRHYFAAGVPWFATLFGRDAATVGIQSLAFSHRTAGQTAELLARYQADRVDAYRDAAPGKILHELRRGSLARANELPQSPAYYGSVDSTLLFLMLIASYVDWSGDLALAERLLPNIERALGWIDDYGDHDGDGYLDYVGRYGNGLINQGWKDSGNGIVHADGSLPEPPIAPVEVQGYLYRAWRDTARLLRRLGEDRRPQQLEDRAAALAERFDRDFWSDELGCYLLARARGCAPVASVTSNAAHVLFTGIARPERAAAVARRMLADDMFSGWGVRTLSSDHVAYNPVGYHLGTVWPHDNAIIVDGLRRYGLDDAAQRIFSPLAEAACSLPQFRLPELFCGYCARYRPAASGSVSGRMQPASVVRRFAAACADVAARPAGRRRAASPAHRAAGAARLARVAAAARDLCRRAHGRPRRSAPCRRHGRCRGAWRQRAEDRIDDRGAERGRPAMNSAPDAARSRRVVAITGASAGVGRATACAFARQGAAIGLIARGADGLAAAARDVESLGGQAIALSADVADADQVEAAAAKLEEAFGPIDVWVNNAMTAVFAPVKETRPEEFRRVAEVTYLGSVHGTLAALRRMLPRNRGVIIQVGSALAHRGIPLQATYCAAKHAIEGFCDSLRTELLHDRSRVQLAMVHVPAMNTPQFDWVKSKLPRKAQPVPPIYQPEVAARAIVWLADHPRRRLWVGWPTVAVLLANRVAPGLLDRYLARTGYASQQSDEPEIPDRPDNLWQPVAGDHGAHGRFDARAEPVSVQAWATMHKGWLLAATAIAVAAAIAGRAHRKRVRNKALPS